MLKEGMPAPDFTLPDENGENVSLSSLRGRKVVLYFYPKDDTPGCTKEACGFRDVWHLIREKNAAVYGVSADGRDSHRKFKEKYGLPFPLLSDEDRTVIERFGAWGEKIRFGKLGLGLIRSTFIIDEQGIVRKVFPNVKPEDHAEEVLAEL